MTDKIYIVNFQDMTGEVYPFANFYLGLERARAVIVEQMKQDREEDGKELKDSEINWATANGNACIMDDLTQCLYTIHELTGE